MAQTPQAADRRRRHIAKPRSINDRGSAGLLFVSGTLLGAVPTITDSLKNKSLLGEKPVGSLNCVSEPHDCLFAIGLLPKKKGEISSTQSSVRGCIVNASHDHLLNILVSRHIRIGGNIATRSCRSIWLDQDDIAVSKVFAWEKCRSKPTFPQDKASMPFTDFVLFAFKINMWTSSAELPHYAVTVHIPP